MDAETESSRVDSYFDRVAALMVDEIEVVDLDEDNAHVVVSLIRNGLGAFEEVGSVLASSFRRIENMIQTYSQEGAKFFVARDKKNQRVIGGAGIGPLAGLPSSEGIGEIREMVLEESYRGRGIGTLLLKQCLEAAKELKYQRIYLETTPQMLNAQRLFKKFGFRGVNDAPGVKTKKEAQDHLPSYFLLEDIDKALTKGKSAN